MPSDLSSVVMWWWYYQCYYVVVLLVYLFNYWWVHLNSGQCLKLILHIYFKYLRLNLVSTNVLKYLFLNYTPFCLLQRSGVHHHATYHHLLVVADISTTRAGVWHLDITPSRTWSTTCPHVAPSSDDEGCTCSYRAAGWVHLDYWRHKLWYATHWAWFIARFVVLYAYFCGWLIFHGMC